MHEASPTRLLFSHFGPVTDVDRVFEESEAELHYWVEQVSQAYHAGLDLEHAVAMVHEKDRERHRDFYSDPERVAKFEELSSTQLKCPASGDGSKRPRPRPNPGPAPYRCLPILTDPDRSGPGCPFVRFMPWCACVRQ